LQVCSIDEQLRTLRDMVSRLLGPDVKLTMLARAPRAKIRMDLAQLQQIVLNIAMNARDAMPEGGKLTVATSNINLSVAQARRWKLAPGSYVALKVTDSGCGMDAHTQAHLFEPFFTTKRKGNGLGMPAVREAVTESGGAIAVESQLGKGTTVSILLPRVTKRAPRPRERFLKQDIRPRIHRPTFNPPSVAAPTVPRSG
jgi:signal transduction histidine kinase